MNPAPTATTVDPAEAARFSAMADSWWDPHGQFRPLHRLNPTRIAYIRDRVAAHFGRDPLAPLPLKGLRLLDIGCGGGLLSEPMARLGADVVGVDVAERNIQVASLHAARVGLEVDYRVGTAEALAETGERFDVVLNMEVIEHVAHVDLFVAACAEMVRPGGAMILATLNRTLKSLALAKIGAEYVLRWLPRGTHDWRRFMHPHEVAAHMRRHGLAVGHVAGMSYDLFAEEWRLSRDLSVNYLMFATKPAE